MPRRFCIFDAEIGLTPSVLYRSLIQAATAMHQSAIPLSFQAPLSLSFSLLNLHSTTSLLTDIHVLIYIFPAILCRFFSSYPLSLLGFPFAALQKALFLSLSLSKALRFIFIRSSYLSKYNYESYLSNIANCDVL